MPPENALDYTSYSWVAGSGPNNPPQQQPLNFKLMQQLSPDWIKPDWLPKDPVNDEPKSVLLGVFQQDPGVQFNLACKLWRWTPVVGAGQYGPPIYAFSCATDGTRIIPGQRHAMPGIPAVIPDALKLIGPYIESIHVRMGFGPEARAQLKARSPDTDSESGDMSSSISYDFGFGFFGLDATGSFSASYTNSHSMQLTDYQIRSDSDETKTDHTIRLNMLDGGARYTDWNSVIDNPTLPPRATSDTTLSIEGVWAIPGDLQDELEFTVEVSVTFQTVVSGYVPGHYLQCILPDENHFMSGGQWGVSSGVVWGQPTPQLGWCEPHWEKTLTWTQRVNVPLAMANKAASGG